MPALHRVYALVVLVFWNFTAEAAESVAIIVHQNNAVVSLAPGEIKQMFKGELSKWPGGQRIQVIDYREPIALRVEFYNKFLDVSQDQQFFPSGSPIAFKPMRVASESFAKRFVKRLPNAVAYIRLGEVDESIRVLHVFNGDQ